MIMKVILVLILFLLLAAWDMPRLARNEKNRKDLLVYSFLMIIGLALSILFAFQIYLPMWVQE